MLFSKEKVAVFTTGRMTLKCDNTSCSKNSDPYIFPDDAVLDEMAYFVNVPCSECGDAILTEHDFSVFSIMMKMLGWLDNVANAFLPVKWLKHIRDNADRIDFQKDENGKWVSTPTKYGDKL